MGSVVPIAPLGYNKSDTRKGEGESFHVQNVKFTSH